MSILVLIDENKASLSTITATFALAKQNNISNVDAIIFGKNSDSIATSYQGYGFSRIFYSNQNEFENYICSNYGNAIFSILANYKYFVSSANSIGKELAPWIAGKWQAGQASDIVNVNSNGTFKRPVYAGNAFTDLEILTENKVVTVRTSSFAAAEKNNSNSEILYKNFELVKSKVIFKSSEIVKNERPELSSADYVVSGGRALGSSENFEKVIFPLADALNAAIGASRAAVDSGYAPNDWQVGQTGKIVAPKLYIAAGISGAIQHLAGMKDSKKIVAINKDADAPIFEIADYGLVADLFDVLPKITDAVKNLRN